MTVAELIAELQKCDPTWPVIVQSDAEGNGYSPARGMDRNCAYVPETTWHGTVYMRELDAESRRLGYTEEDLTDDPRAVPCVVIHPVN